MIVDTLDHFGDYLGVHPLCGRVADFLGTADLGELAEGRHQIGSEGCFALVSQYITQSRDEGFIECHRRHIDIQILVRGVEGIGVCRRSDAVVSSWDEEGDFETLECQVDFITLRPGSFVIFFPQDGHMPKVRHGAPASVRKVVVKVPVPARATAPSVRGI
jgi:YhcH/YjgK/YiaL family protein